MVAATGVGVRAAVVGGAAGDSALLDGTVAGVVDGETVGLTAAVVVTVGLGVLLEVTGTAAGANRTAVVVVGPAPEDGDG